MRHVNRRDILLQNIIFVLVIVLFQRITRALGNNYHNMLSIVHSGVILVVGNIIFELTYIGQRTV